MSHLAHKACGVDFFLSYNKCSQSVIDLIENIKVYFDKNEVTYFSNDYIEFSQNYLHAFQLQAIRSKIFLFFIDKYALECEWFMNFYVYAKEHSSISHLPILIPVVFDDELEAENEDDETTKFDKNLKLKLIDDLTAECSFSIKMSEISSFGSFMTSLKEIVDDIIPINIENDDYPVQKRHADNNRPITLEEEKFFNHMKSIELNSIKKFKISRICMRYILPKLKTYVALSVPYTELNSHLSTMINVQCHLIWIDSILINKINYFNLIWQNNDEDYEINSLSKLEKAKTNKPYSFTANSPSYLIFYDLNTAQIAKINHELCNEGNWTVQLVESYIKCTESDIIKRENRVKTSKPRLRTAKPNATEFKQKEKNEEIFYICQFKLKSNPASKGNKLQQGIIDTRYDESFKEAVRYHNDKLIYIPIRSTPLLVNVNTSSNKHYYFSSIYMPYENFKPIDSFDFNEKKSDLKKTSLFSTSKNLNDLELISLYEEYTQLGWKLIDLKAYKDEKSLTEFSTIWSSCAFYEGTTRLLIGLNKSEALDGIDEMNSKGMYPKLVTSYCYSSTSGEHLYAIFFCQF